MDALLARRADRLLGGTSDAHCKLLERCPVRKHQWKPESILRIRREAHAGLPQLAQSLRAQPREVRQPGEGEERLVGGDVGGRLLAADVLLPGLQGEDIAAFTRGVGRLADDAARHAPDVVRAHGDEPVVRPAVRLVVAGALPFADRNRAAVAPGRLEDSERDRVDVRHRESLGVVRDRCELGRRLEAAEEVRLLEDDAGGVFGRLADVVRVGDAVGVRNLDDLEPEAGRVRLHDLPDLRVQRLREDDLRPAGRVLRDVAGVRGHRRAVVPRGVGDVHTGELADHRLVLEDRLEDALAHLRLVRRVRGQELAAGEDRVHDRGHVVVVDPCAEERELLARVGIPPRKLFEMGDELRLRERRLEVERPVEADSLGDVLEELVDGRDPDCGEHRLLVGVREREVAHATALREVPCTPPRRGARRPRPDR